MSIPAHEDGLVEIYVDKIAALGVKAADGSDVSKEIAVVVKEAAAHFAVVKSSTESGNLKRFSGMLIVRATANESQPQYSEVFKQAKAMADEIIKTKAA